MENLILNNLRKKKIHIGLRVSEAERNMLNEFCRREQISITDLVRYAIRKVINQQSEK